MKVKNIAYLTLISIVITTLNSKIFAQAKYYKGYVILLTGDTLSGEIKKNPKKEFDNFEKASYRKKEGQEMKSFNPGKIKEYGVDTIVFVSRKIEGEQLFVKRLSAGTFNLYESQSEVQQMNEVKIKSEYYFEKKGETELVKIKSGKFKKQVAEVMADNKEILDGLENKKYDYENVVEVFDKYNKASKN